MTPGRVREVFIIVAGMIHSNKDSSLSAEYMKASKNMSGVPVVHQPFNKLELNIYQSSS